MLSMLRDATKGWTAKILLVLLVASFAVWGVSGSILQGTGNAVVTVGETTVGPVEYRLAYDRQLNQIQQQLGNRITREQADAFGLSNNVLTQLVSGALLDESARTMGLGISDNKLAGLIGDDPAFRDQTGRFSRLQLQQVLRSIGMPEAQYVETRKAVAVRNQVIEGTTGLASLPDAYWSILERFQAEERKFNYVVISQNDIAPINDPDEEALKAFYEANLADYEAPEFRKLNIVKLEAEDIADPASVSEEDVASEYEARKTSFSEPEKRTIEQLVFTDAVLAQTASDAIKSGKSFEEVVTDQGKQVADISLGTLAKSDIPDPAIAEAAFSLEANTVSDLVDGTFGKVLLRVTSVEPGSTKALEEVEDQIRRDIAIANATEALYDTHDALEDERAAGEPLNSAAQTVGLSTRVIKAVDRTARDMDGNIINDIPQSQALLQNAFDTDPGIETDPLSIGTDGFVWFEVVEVINERQKPFDEVRDEVRTDWMKAETSKAVIALAESIRERIAGGEAFNAVLADALPTEQPSARGEETEETAAQPRILQQSLPLKRNANTPELPQTAVSQGFQVAKGSVLIADGAGEDVKLVIQVAEVQQGATDAISADEKNTFNTTLSDDIVSQLVTRLQADVDVEINQQAINAALAY